MKRFAIVYASTLVVLIPLDFAFLLSFGKRLFADNVPDMTLASPRLPPAILFYVPYLCGVVVFVNGASRATCQTVLTWNGETRRRLNQADLIFGEALRRISDSHN